MITSLWFASHGRIINNLTTVSDGLEKGFSTRFVGPGLGPGLSGRSWFSCAAVSQPLTGSLPRAYRSILILWP